MDNIFFMLLQLFILIAIMAIVFWSFLEEKSMNKQSPEKNNDGNG